MTRLGGTMPFMGEWIPPQTENEKLSWLRLYRSENVGPATFFALMARHRSPEGALAALPDLAKRGGLKRQIKLADLGERNRRLHF